MLFLNGTIKIVHTVPWPHYPSKKCLQWLPEASIVQQVLFFHVRWNCSIVRVQQLQMFYHRRCCMSASRCMFGSLWKVVIAHKHRIRQNGSHSSKQAHHTVVLYSYKISVTKCQSQCNFHVTFLHFSVIRLGIQSFRYIAKPLWASFGLHEFC